MDGWRGVALWVWVPVLSDDQSPPPPSRLTPAHTNPIPPTHANAKNNNTQARAFEAEKAMALQELREAGERELRARLDKEMATFTERLTQVGWWSG